MTFRPRRHVGGASLALSLWAACAFATPRVSTIPVAPLIERARDSQRLSFDLLFENSGDTPLVLTRLEVTWFDAGGGFVGQQRLDTNGDETTMSIITIPNRSLPGRSRLVVFNPFWRFPLDVTLGRMHYEATFDAGDSLPAQTVALDVLPQVYATAPPLLLPLAGEVFVHDGHDFTAHHRRLDITGGMTTHFGITGNFMRYAHDFVVTDRQGRMFRTDGARPEDWFGYGAPIRAPAAGVVREMSDGIPDNRKGSPPPFGEAELMKNLRLFLGNHVVIEHADGTFSLLAHMKQGSVRVKSGDRVARGAPLGEMGMSGDAFLVHLHYQHQSGPGFEEGLPAYFERVRVRNGRGWSLPFTGPVDSGDVVEAVASAK